jgi:hypothetical protein
MDFQTEFGKGSILTLLNLKEQLGGDRVVLLEDPVERPPIGL